MCIIKPSTLAKSTVNIHYVFIVSTLAKLTVIIVWNPNSNTVLN